MNTGIPGEMGERRMENGEVVRDMKRGRREEEEEDGRWKGSPEDRR